MSVEQKKKKKDICRKCTNDMFVNRCTVGNCTHGEVHIFDALKLYAHKVSDQTVGSYAHKVSDQKDVDKKDQRKESMHYTVAIGGTKWIPIDICHFCAGVICSSCGQYHTHSGFLCDKCLHKLNL